MAAVAMAIYVPLHLVRHKYAMVACLCGSLALSLLGAWMIATTLEAGAEGLAPKIKKGPKEYVEKASAPVAYHLLTLTHLAGGGLLVATACISGVFVLKEKFPKRSQSKLIVFQRNRRKKRQGGRQSKITNRPDQ